MNDKLDMWQRRYSHNRDNWANKIAEFDKHEAMVKGTDEVEPMTENDRKHKVKWCRNVCFELIEAQIDSSIPAAKVTAKNREDEQLAKIIEDMINDEIHRLPMEEINDMQERTVPIQGGAFYLVEWDNSLTTQNTVGDITIQAIHPKQFVPQDGVYNIDDMDYFFLVIPQTKEYIKNRYGIDVKDEGEEEPDVRGQEASEANGMVTQYIAYYKNDKGGIGKYSWVGDIVLEDLEDYQARQLSKCEKCGAIVPVNTVPLDKPSEDGTYPYGERDNEIDFEGTEGQEPSTGGKAKCPYCGGKVKRIDMANEKVFADKTSTMGVQIPGLVNGMPTEVPYYSPGIYPVVLQRSVSCFGQLLGTSDLDQIETQQNVLKRLSTKMTDLIINGGSFVTLPPDVQIRTDVDEMKTVRLTSPADKSLIDVYTNLPAYSDINALLSLYSEAYEESRQAIGITDSYQGRRDTTATSGKAKEFSAQQSAGRLQSKRTMKEAAYQRLFEAIFKFKLAYTDEPRPIMARDENGDMVYETFDRYDFLKQDETGQFYWNDQFIFDVDPTTPLAKDREVLWQETRMNLQTGAFGNPQDLNTLILFWRKMEEYHYPGSSDTKKYLMKQKEQQDMMMQQQAMIQQNQIAAQQQVQEDAVVADAVQNILGGQNEAKKTSEKN